MYMFICIYTCNALCVMPQMCRSEVNLQKLILSLHLVGLEAHSQVIRLGSRHHDPLRLLANLIFFFLSHFVAQCILELFMYPRLALKF